MIDTGALRVTAQSEREVLMTRVFNAPRHLVFEAMTKPELIKRWLGVQGGWSLAICEVDLTVGGAYRYVWRHEPDGAEMGMGGIYKEIVAPERLVCTEQFDQAWYPGGALITQELIEQEGKTLLKSTLCYASTEARDMVLNSPMEGGVAESYNKLEAMLTTTA